MVYDFHADPSHGQAAQDVDLFCAKDLNTFSDFSQALLQLWKETEPDFAVFPESLTTVPPDVLI